MSILISKHIVKQLSVDSEIVKSVGDRIYPIVIPEGSNYPFIMFEDYGSGPETTKDGTCEDNASCNIAIVAKNYNEAVTVANKTRYVLEGKLARYDDFEVTECNLESWSKNYDADLPAYVVRLTLNFKTIDF